jgi:hypothetical protein
VTDQETETDAVEGDDEGQPNPEDQWEDAERSKELYDAAKRLVAGKQISYATTPGFLDSPRLKAVFDAAGITGGAGEPGTIGRLLLAFERYLDSVGVDVLLVDLNFASSVVMEFDAPVSPAERSAIKELKESALPEDPETIQDAIPASVIRLEMATRLLNEAPRNVARRSRAAGVVAQNQLRRLAEALDDAEASLRVTSPAETVARLPERRARAVAQTLARAQTGFEPLELTIVGHLSRTDSEAETFRVILDRKREQPAELGNRRQIVQGDYTERASKQVRERGLWDADVVAKVRATRAARPGGKRRPYLASFTFLDLRPVD